WPPVCGCPGRFVAVLRFGYPGNPRAERRQYALRLCPAGRPGRDRQQLSDTTNGRRDFFPPASLQDDRAFRGSSERPTVFIRSFFRLVMVAGLSASAHAANAVSLDLPALSSEFLRTETLLDGDTIRFCVYGGSAIGDYDRAVAQLLGDSLFLEVEIYEVEPPIVVPGMDTIPISLEDLFLMLTNECDAFMGLELASSV